VTCIWIIGGGRFGQTAASRLKRKYPNAHLVVVEQNFEKCAKIKQASFEVVCMDGIAFLSSCLSDTSSPDWIIPAAPVHVAYLWIREQLSSEFHVMAETVPDEILSVLPNPIRGKNREIYMSLAEFICPEDCPEPEDICTFTRKARSYSLFEHLEKVGNDQFKPVVIRSHQLAPGVGGYTPEMLCLSLEKVKTSGPSILVSSACRCHGVMNAFSIYKDRVE